MGSVPTPGAVLTAYATSLIKIKAGQLCRKNGFGRSDEEDFVQELTLRLLEKERLYDPNRASIETFADRVIHSAVKMIVRDRWRLKRAAGFTALSLETTVVGFDRKPIVLCEIVSIADRQRLTLAESRGRDRLDDDDLRETIESLPPQLADIAQRLKSGTVASVARDLGVSRRHIYTAIARIRRHFEIAGLGES